MLLVIAVGIGGAAGALARYGSTASSGAVVGFLGAYTTFSTFAQETRDLLTEGHLALGLVNAAGSTAIGVAAVVLGTATGRAL
jgi:fluoride ion exporter CrcB/FEX